MDILCSLFLFSRNQTLDAFLTGHSAHLVGAVSGKKMCKTRSNTLIVHAIRQVLPLKFITYLGLCAEARCEEGNTESQEV